MRESFNQWLGQYSVQAEATLAHRHVQPHPSWRQYRSPAGRTTTTGEFFGQRRGRSSRGRTLSKTRTRPGNADGQPMASEAGPRSLSSGLSKELCSGQHRGAHLLHRRRRAAHRGVAASCRQCWVGCRRHRGIIWPHSHTSFWSSMCLVHGGGSIFDFSAICASGRAHRSSSSSRTLA